MRHFVCLPGPVPVLALTRGVGVTPAKAGLITFPGGLYAAGAHPSGALGTAVTVAAVAVAADDHGYATAGAQVTSGRRLHRQIGPTGFGWTKPDAS